MEPKLKSQAILDIIKKEEESGTKSSELLKLLEERIKDLGEVSDEQDYHNFGHLFRKWIAISKEIRLEGGQQEGCCLFSPMIDYVLKKSRSNFIYVNHLSQYQAEQAVLKWFRKTIKISAKDGKTMKVEIVVGRGEKLSISIPALFKEFGISASILNLQEKLEQLSNKANSRDS